MKTKLEQLKDYLFEKYLSIRYGRRAKKELKKIDKEKLISEAMKKMWEQN